VNSRLRYWKYLRVRFGFLRFFQFSKCFLMLSSYCLSLSSDMVLPGLISIAWNMWLLPSASNSSGTSLKSLISDSLLMPSLFAMNFAKRRWSSSLNLPDCLSLICFGIMRLGSHQSFEFRFDWFGFFD